MSAQVLNIGSRFPFKHFYREYFDKGWLPFPLPPSQKAPPPGGCTGHFPAVGVGVMEKWAKDYDERSNIGLRVPDGVIGIDVDSYGNKKGKESLSWLEFECGPLLSTWTLTSRKDGVSGIRFYRVEKGRMWPSKFSQDIETIQFMHRYAVGYPSIHPDTKQMYKWYEPGAPLDGKSFSSVIPNLLELELL